MQHTILIIAMLLMAALLTVPMCYLIMYCEDNYLMGMYATLYLVYLSGVMVAVYDKPAHKK